MTIRRRLQLVYLLILLSTVGIGALAVWSVASWHRASVGLTYSHLQGERVERVRGDIYRLVKEVVDWLTHEDKDADEEFRQLAAMISAEVGALEAETRRDEERRAILDLRHSYGGLLTFAESVFTETQANPMEMSSLEERIESQLFPELERHIETLRSFYRVEAARSIRGTERIQGLTRGLVVMIVLLSLVQGGILLFGIQRWLVRPLAEINRSTTIISTGDFEHRVVLQSRDEMGDLAQAVNRMAQELRQSQARLVESERLAALGELVGYIAHNIRNPLASMRAAAQVGREQVHESREAFRDVIDTVDRLEEWVQDLLSYMKPVSPHLAAGDLNDVIRKALAVFRNEAAWQGPQLVEELRPLPPVDMDAHLMEQALVAVMTNAIEASTAGGKIFVSSRVSGSTVAVDVRDEGEAIPQDVMDNAFAPYFTTKPNGVGLGLAVARKVMSAHQGSIELRNDAGQGTTVTLYCPVADSQGT